MADRTRVKICGIRDAETAWAASDAGADAIGLVFVEKSPRSIEPEAAAEILFNLPPMLTAVGLFQNHSLDAFLEIEAVCPTPMTQLHGSEPEKLVSQCGPGVIKSVRFDAATIDRELTRWDAVDEVDAILVDGSAGGEGTAFDWAELAGAIGRTGIGKPIILAGGLAPGNVAEAIRAVRPFAVDVSSGVERERGVKDLGLIEAFCKAVRGADAG